MKGYVTTLLVDLGVRFEARTKSSDDDAVELSELLNVSCMTTPRPGGAPADTQIESRITQ